MTSLKTLIASLALAAVAAPTLAAPETFKLDPNHSFPRFSYSHFGYSTQLSRFDKTAGTITLDRAAKTGAVDITIDTKSVSTGSSLFNEHIQAEDFLDTARYPIATFKSTKAVFDGSKPVTLKVTSFHSMPHPMTKKDAIGANATVTVKRTDFNMGKYAPNVGDEVIIDIAVEAIKE